MNFGKKPVGLNYGIFFQNSSGHPDCLHTFLTSNKGGVQSDSEGR
jgi:hypothetical protein